jgi:hypothetical protein
MDDWLRSAMAAIGSDVALTEEEERTLLDLARIAAHKSGERTNAPLLCYLLGRAQGDRTLAELAEAVRRSSS